MPSVLSLEPVLETYFDSLNQGDFTATAALFSPTGSLRAPFEAPLVGPAAIASYLEQEAKGLQAQPQQLSLETTEAGQRQAVVTGTVKTQLFTLNVRWLFTISPEGSLEQVEIKLLASLEALIRLQPSPSGQ
jgi:SnoaL-like domain